MVSELATNSIRHAATSFTVIVERVPGMVRVEVIDSGEGEPKMRAPAVSDPTGRGLRIVEELADDWGVVPTPDGKMVWFVLMTPSDARVST